MLCFLDQTPQLLSEGSVYFFGKPADNNEGRLRGHYSEARLRATEPFVLLGRYSTSLQLITMQQLMDTDSQNKL